jgi:hypothetical protein
MEAKIAFRTDKFIFEYLKIKNNPESPIGQEGANQTKVLKNPNLSP